VRVLGLSSGTSHDGIDAALVEFAPDGETLHARLLHYSTTPYPAALREDIRAALPPHRVGLDAVCRLDTRIGQAFAGAAAAVFDGVEADLICSHGQTLYHWADEDGVHGTLQLGQPAWIAERTGLPVVADVRARDVAAGGQGAPLVAILDLLLLAGFSGRPGALNLGGIANLTIHSGPSAYDIGPGNALLDLAAFHFTGTPCDVDGALAARGQVHPELLAHLLVEPYYRRQPPKSTGKELFHPGYLDGLIDGIAAEDVLATLVELTVATIASEVRRHSLDTVIVSGGGVHNPVMMRRLAESLRTTRLIRSDAVGVPVDAKEAMLFALIGWLTAHGLAGSVAACTGARTATILGSVTGPLVPRTASMPSRLAASVTPGP
jgi:anhydro-N-acetylmuramic acid kinase